MAANVRLSSSEDLPPRPPQPQRAPGPPRCFLRLSVCSGLSISGPKKGGPQKRGPFPTLFPLFKGGPGRSPGAGAPPSLPPSHALRSGSVRGELPAGRRGSRRRRHEEVPPRFDEDQNTPRAPPPLTTSKTHITALPTVLIAYTERQLRNKYDT